MTLHLIPLPTDHNTTISDQTFADYRFSMQNDLANIPSLLVTSPIWHHHAPLHNPPSALSHSTDKGSTGPKQFNYRSHPRLRIYGSS
jgi:hypothetical protein